LANGTYTLGGCTGDLHCPNFSLNNPTEQTCIAENDPVQDKLQCKSYKKKNEACSSSEPCHQDYYCKTTNSTSVCAKRASKGDDCNTLDQCEIGHICNQNVCVKYFKVADGEAADSKLACKSAIVKDGVCQPASESVGDLPIKCSKNTDCTATDGTIGQCVCVPNKKGSSYCKLHLSDSIVKEALAASNDGFVEHAAYLLAKSMNYPIPKKAADCYFDEANELVDYTRVKKWDSKCTSSGLWLALTGLVLGLL